MEADIINYNFERICRICKQNSESLLELKNGISNLNKLLVDLFNELFSLDADIDDALPQHLCGICVRKVLYFYGFIQTAHQADHDFRQMLEEQDEKNLSANTEIESEGVDSDFEGNINEYTDESSTELLASDKDTSIISTEIELISDIESEEEDQSQSAFKAQQLPIQQNTCCGKDFSSAASYRSHIATHKSIDDLTCKLCLKKFANRSNLKIHMSTHTDTRPYICHICSKSFRQRSIYNTHMTLHEGKRIECDICYKKFSRMAHLQVHMRTHTGNRPYKCHLCESAYVQKSHLDRHVDWHNGVRYECNECHKIYTKKSSLTQHFQANHKNDKTFHCSTCSMKFRKQKAYYYHMKSKHAEKIPKENKTHVQTP